MKKAIRLILIILAVMLSITLFSKTQVKAVGETGILIKNDYEGFEHKYTFNESTNTHVLEYYHKDLVDNQTIKSGTKLYEQLEKASSLDPKDIARFYFKVPEGTSYVKFINGAGMELNPASNIYNDDLYINFRENSFIIENNKMYLVKNGTEKVEFTPKYVIAGDYYIAHKWNNEIHCAFDGDTGYVVTTTYEYFDVEGNSLGRYNYQVITHGKAKTTTHSLIEGDKAERNEKGIFVIDINSKAKIQGYHYQEKAELTDVNFVSSDENIVKVSSNGELKLLKQGSAIITIENEYGIIEKLNIEVIGNIENNEEQDKENEKDEEVNTDNFDEKNLGNKDILEQTILPNTILEIKLEDSKKIEKTVFEVLKTVETAKVKFEKNNIVWNFVGKDITNTNIEFIPEVDVSDTKFETIKNEKISDGVFVDFKHDGVLPGKAEVVLNIGTAKYGTGSKTLYLYYYNTTSEEYEFVDEVSYTDGVAEFALDHCSTYVILQEKIAKENAVLDETKDESPKSGVENTSIIVVSLVTIAAFIGMILLNKKED